MGAGSWLCTLDENYRECLKNIIEEKWPVAYAEELEHSVIALNGQNYLRRAVFLVY